MVALPDPQELPATLVALACLLAQHCDFAATWVVLALAHLAAQSAGLQFAAATFVVLAPEHCAAATLVALAFLLAQPAGALSTFATAVLAPEHAGTASTFATFSVFEQLLAATCWLAVSAGGQASAAEAAKTAASDTSARRIAS